MPRVLVVDDNISMRDAIGEMLVEAGYETLVAANGSNAAQIHRATPLDLIITDLFMPDTDGLEIIYKFRRDYPAVKIIAMSGGGSRGLVELLAVAKKMGAQRTLMKPFGGDELLDAVREVLAGPTGANS
jgi:CheY-like chemotaxis protein